MASVCHSPRHTSPLAHSSFGIHLTRCDDHYPFPRRQGSRHFGFNSDRLVLALTGNADLRLHPFARSSSLTRFTFEGVNKYLEDLVARIDAPLLGNLDIRYDSSTNSYSILHNSPSSSVAHQISRHAIKRACLSTVIPPRSHFQVQRSLTKHLN